MTKRGLDGFSGELPFETDEFLSESSKTEESAISVLNSLALNKSEKPNEKKDENADRVCEVCGGGPGGCPQCGFKNKLFNSSELPRRPRFLKPRFLKNSLSKKN